MFAIIWWIQFCVTYSKRGGGINATQKKKNNSTYNVIETLIMLLGSNIYIDSVYT